MIHYLPSCKVKANMPNESKKIQKYLLEKGVNVVGCCRVSQNQFSQGDIVLNNCTSCAIITDEQSPNVKTMSLYEYLLTDDSFPWPNLNGEKITIQDCYRANDKPKQQKAIRECLKKMNVDIVELDENFDKCRFDGAFKYAKVSDENKRLAPCYFNKFEKEFIELLDKEQINEELEKHFSKYTTKKVVCYCNSCRKSLKEASNIEGLHILELITINL